MAALERSKSEDVIINAPMSFAGAAQRAFRLRRIEFGPRWVSLTVMTAVTILVTLVWWVAVGVWYFVIFVLFGILFLPYRILRRGARKRKVEARRHREVMAAMEAQQRALPTQAPGREGGSADAPDAPVAPHD